MTHKTIPGPLSQILEKVKATSPRDATLSAEFAPIYTSFTQFPAPPTQPLRLYTDELQILLDALERFAPTEFRNLTYDEYISIRAAFKTTATELDYKRLTFDNTLKNFLFEYNALKKQYAAYIRQTKKVCSRTRALLYTYRPPKV